MYLWGVVVVMKIMAVAVVVTVAVAVVASVVVMVCAIMWSVVRPPLQVMA